MEATPRTRQAPGKERLPPHSPDGEPPQPAPASRLSAAAGSCHHEPGGRPNNTERPHPKAGTPDQPSCRRGSTPRPAHPGKAGCLPPRPPRCRHGWSPAQKGQPPEPLTPSAATQHLPAPRPAESAPGRPRQGRPRHRLRRPGSRPVLDPPARAQNPAAISGQGADSGTPEIRAATGRSPSNERLRSPADTGKAARARLSC
jgi:hypothetical protein